MVKVILSYRVGVCSDVLANNIAAHIQGIVAIALDCDNPDGHLTSSDVEVKVERIGPMDRTKFDLHIEVEANDYPERRVNLGSRRVEIGLRTCHALAALEAPDLKSFVRVKLMPTSFGEF